MIKIKYIPGTIFLLILLFTYQISNAETGNLEKISTLLQKTEILIEEGEYDEALKSAQEALSLRKNEFGPKHYLVAESLGIIAKIHYYSVEYEQAEPLYKEIIAIYENEFGSEHFEIGIALNNLALLYLESGDLKKAEQLFNNALVICEKNLGTENPTVATILNNLGLISFNLGNHAKAKNLYKKALNISDKVMDPEHPTVAMILNNLGMVYLVLGKYEMAEQVYRKALSINKKKFGPEHVEVAKNLLNLASCYYKMGDNDQTETLYEQGLAILENELEDDDPLLTRTRNNLAVLYDDMGNDSKAEQLHLRALDAREKAVDPNLFDVAESLNNLGAFYGERSKYAKAEEFLNRALKINIKLLGDEHIRIATTQGNLAFIYEQLGEYKKAQEYYEKSFALYKKIFGSEHSEVSDMMINLALFYASQGNLTKAFQLTMQSQKTNNKLIDTVMGFTSDKRKLNFLISKEESLHVTLSFLFQPTFSHDLSIQKDILNIWFKRKGLILETQKKYHEALFYSDNKQISQAAMELSKVRSRLSKLIFSTPSQKNIDTYKNEIAQLEKQKEELEATLSKLSKVFATERKKSNVTCVKIAQAMPSNTVLVDFARISQYDFKNKNNDQTWLPDRYIAFIIHVGNGDKIDWIDFGPADEIDNEISAFRKMLAGKNTDITEDKIKNLKKLHALIFQPLKSKIGNIKEIFISPDGDLSLLPFEIILNTDDKFLIEDYTFNYLSAGRDILGFGETIEESNKSLIIGNPDFNMNSDQKKTTIKKLELKTHDKNRVTKRSKDFQRNSKWPPLPGTQNEVQTIYNLIGKDKAELFTDKKAMEEVLLNWGAPKILHLATHGFFLKNEPIDFKINTAIDRGFSPQGDNDQIISPSPAYMNIENPLLRSGIVLAGANKISITVEDTISDGIVTSEEILGMNLRGTEMVVLSACDTGLGEVRNGEGVFGLRRAFTQAGAKSLVMSMWKVPDKETKELMVTFYSNIYKKGMNRSQALRQATLKQMKITKDRYGNSNPYYWGAFIFMGEP
jgi:CHAT domain-containing protein/Tfp pilus assembly protein PilF